MQVSGQTRACPQSDALCGRVRAQSPAQHRNVEGAGNPTRAVVGTQFSVCVSLFTLAPSTDCGEAVTNHFRALGSTVSVFIPSSALRVVCVLFLNIQLD